MNGVLGVVYAFYIRLFENNLIGSGILFIYIK
jgi:hypothetical protein